MGDDGSDTHAASVSIGAGGGGSRARSPAAPAKARIIYNSKSNSCESFDVMLSFPLSVSVGSFFVTYERMSALIILLLLASSIINILLFFIY